MEPLLVYPDPPPPELAQALDLGGYPWKAVGRRGRASRAEPDDGWGGAVVVRRRRPRGGVRAAAGALRKRDIPVEPLLLLVSGAQLGDLELRDDLFDDFCLDPFHPRELEARLRHLFWRTGRGTRPELVEYGGLVLNLETYQAAIDGRPLDLTYMEYELLKFLAQHPGKVFTRETLLSPGVGLRVLRRRPHGRRPHPAPAGQARRGARQPHPDGALRRLPLRPVPLERLAPGMHRGHPMKKTSLGERVLEHRRCRSAP